MRPRLPGKLDNEQIKNVIPEPQVTVPPQIRMQPFDYDGETYIGGSEKVGQVDFTNVGEEEEEEEEEEEADVDNQLNPRGDVFSKPPFPNSSPLIPLFISILGGPKSDYTNTDHMDFHTPLLLWWCVALIVIQKYYTPVASAK